MGRCTRDRSRLLLLASTVLMLGACASKPLSPEALLTPADGYTQPIFSSERVVPDDVMTPPTVDDPWNRWNRSVYRFNAGIDNVMLNPLVNGYRFITPSFARTGVTNFFDNLDDIRTLINQALQGRPARAGQSTLRFLTNSTIGLAGLFDVASRFGIPKYDEDFGQTLGRYGVGPGPYLMLPLLGPSTLRDAFGRAVDAGISTAIDPLGLEDESDRGLVYYPLLIIDTRHTTAFQYFETGSPFEYGLVRRVWVTKRELDIEK